MDEFSHEYKYVGSNIEINKNDRRIKLKYLGEGELGFKTPVKNQEIIASIEVLEKPTNKENIIIEKECILLEDGNEYISLGLLKEIGVNSNLSSGSIVLSSSYSSLEINNYKNYADEIYILMKDVLDYFNVFYQYKEKDIIIVNDMEVPIKLIN